MIYIYSKVSPETLLHIVFRCDDFSDGRISIVPGTNFLQCSALELCEGTTFRPHFHIWKAGEPSAIAQESWVVLRGAVRVTFYDLDNTVLYECELSAGDASFTLQGGHNYLILMDGTLVYEYKTGPYRGQQYDKSFI